jgi:hypothetical protein
MFEKLNVVEVVELKEQKSIMELWAMEGRTISSQEWTDKQEIL